MRKRLIAVLCLPLLVAAPAALGSEGCRGCKDVGYEVCGLGGGYYILLDKQTCSTNAQIIGDYCEVIPFPTLCYGESGAPYITYERQCFASVSCGVEPPYLTALELDPYAGLAPEDVVKLTLSERLAREEAFHANMKGRGLYSQSHAERILRMHWQVGEVGEGKK